MSTRIGILSVAHLHGMAYASALSTLPEVTFVGIADSDAHRGQGAASRYKTTFFSTPEELLGQKLDGVIVTSENANHRRDVEACVAAGIPAILCEKPLSSSVEDAEAMVSLCADHNIKLATAFPCRYSPAYLRLREHVRSGALGQILAIRGTNRGSMPGGWFVDKRLSGGGAVIDHTVHVADLNRYLLGTEATSVYAEIGNGFYHQDWDDTGFLAINYSDGVFATLDTSWSRPKTFPTWGDVTMQVVGTAGCADLDMMAQTILHYDDGANKVRELNWGSDLDTGMVADFIAMCNGKDSGNLASGYDGLMALRVAVGAYKSAESHQPVSL